MSATAPRSARTCTVQIRRTLRDAGIAVRTVRTVQGIGTDRRPVQHSVVFLVGDDHETAARALRGVEWARDVEVVEGLFVSVTSPLG